MVCGTCCPEGGRSPVRRRCRVRAGLCFRVHKLRDCAKVRVEVFWEVAFLSCSVELDSPCSAFYLISFSNFLDLRFANNRTYDVSRFRISNCEVPNDQPQNLKQNPSPRLATVASARSGNLLLRTFLFDGPLERQRGSQTRSSHFPAGVLQTAANSVDSRTSIFLL